MTSPDFRSGETSNIEPLFPMWIIPGDQDERFLFVLNLASARAEHEHPLIEVLMVDAECRAQLEVHRQSESLALRRYAGMLRGMVSARDLFLWHPKFWVFRQHISTPLAFLDSSSHNTYDACRTSSLLPTRMDITEDLPFTKLRSTWQPVALARDLLPGQVMSYRLLDNDVMVARFEDGLLLAAENACPHKGMKLSLGKVGKGELQCAYHGWRFNRVGACTNIPSLIEPPVNKLEASELFRYGVQERYGMIWVKLVQTGSAELPRVPEFEDPRWTYMLGPPMVFKAGFRREIENYLDMTHFAFSHSTTLGKAADAVVPDMDITVFDDGFLMDAPFPALKTPHEQPGKLQSAHRRRQRCTMPNFTTIRQTFEDGDERILVHIPSPNTMFECTVFWALAISPGFRGPSPDDQIAFATRVLDEDRTMCENQVPREVPINPARGGWGVLVTPGDTLANTFQKVFRKYLLS